MPLNPDHVAVSRMLYNGEYSVLTKLVEKLNTKITSSQGYYFIDLGKTKVRDTSQIQVTRFAENIILWLCDCFNITVKQSIILEGAYSGYIFDYYMTLYEYGIEPSKRFVCLTDKALMNDDDPMLYPEVFCETYDQAIFYFTKVESIENIVDIYEDDDRYEEI